MANETEERVTGALLAFVDFLYAVVFGLIVSEVFTEVLSKQGMSYPEKTGRMVLLIAAFYYLTWDWIHGRLLTLKNPYTRYTRFFLEIIIAASAYGAAIAALDRNIYLLVPIAVILAVGALWAWRTMVEYPDSRDKPELKLIIRNQTIASIASLMLFFLYLNKSGSKMGILMGGTIVVLGWVFVIWYEASLVRTEKGILAGPGVLLPTKFIDWLNKKITR